MYGFIYNTLRTLVVEKFGDEEWRNICAEAGCPLMKEGIVDRHYYDEAILAKVGTMAEKRLGIPLEKILELFGAFFFETCKKSGHSSMLRTLGHNLYGFLMNLDSLHDHLSFTYTEMQAPSFLCEKTPSGLTLHYYSQRHGLSNIVIGIVRAVAKDFYSLEIDMEMVKYEKIKQKLAHHYVFAIVVQECNRDETYHERLTGERCLLPESAADEQISFNLPTSPLTKCPIIGIEASTSRGPASPIRSVKSPEHELREKLKRALPSEEAGDDLPTPVLPHIPYSRMTSRRGSTYPLELDNWPITQSIFQTCFPFHIIFDRELTIRFMGVSVSRLFPKAIAKEQKLTDHFELTRPALALNFENILGSIHNIFIMRTKKNLTSGREIDESDALHFRGQMVPTSSHEGFLIMFLGSPRVNSIEELEHQGLYLSDIPVHDVTRDLILLNRHFRVEMGIAKELEETKRDLQIQKTIAEEEKHRADDLLHAMLPRAVANNLKKQQEVSAKDFPAVTILFSDIKGFTNICNKCSPIQVVEMLNRLYTHFDSQLERHNVYKVETIGDAYMVAAGLLDTSEDHAAAIVNMAFAMREEAGKVMDPVNNVPLKIRIGIHSGGVVAGVVGLKMPRYCLFGDTVNTASRMESHGEPGRIHISAATYDLLKCECFSFFNRGEIEVKGLGRKQTYFVEPVTECAETIIVRPDSTDKNLASPPDTSSSSLHEHHENGTIRNSSFITLSPECRKVQPHTSQQTPQFEEPPTPLANGSRGLEMARPNHPPHSNSVTPIPEVKEPEEKGDHELCVESPTGQNGAISLFISDRETHIQSEPCNTVQPQSKQRSKCIIS